MKKWLWLALLAAFASTPAFSGEKNPKNPVVEDAPDGSGRQLLLPADIKKALLTEFPTYRIPKDSDYNAEMFTSYNQRLVGVHPAVAFGDFNGDKKRDYAFIIITGDSKWGPVCELVVFNGKGREYEAFRLGEIYTFKDEYVSFMGNKLTKGRHKKSAWHINWDKKNNTYKVLKG
jgi:hypothetical protein